MAQLQPSEEKNIESMVEKLFEYHKSEVSVWRYIQAMDPPTRYYT